MRVAVHLLRRPEYPSHFFFLPPELAALLPPFPVPPAATQSLPANRCILGNKPHFTVAEARRRSSAKQPWKAGQAACSRLCQHPPYPPIHSLPFSHPHRRGPFSFSPCATAAPRLSLIHSVFYFPLSATGSPGSPVQPFVRRQTTAADAARSTPTVPGPQSLPAPTGNVNAAWHCLEKRTWPTLALVSSFRRFVVLPSSFVRSFARSLVTCSISPTPVRTARPSPAFGPPRNGCRRQDTRCETVRLQHAAEAHKSFACDHAVAYHRRPSSLRPAQRPSAPAPHPTWAIAASSGPPGPVVAAAQLLQPVEASPPR